MNVKQYIESGILQDYCLGVLSNKEMLDVEMLAEAHEEIREELRGNQEVLEIYAKQFTLQPSAGIRDTIFNTIDNLIKEENTTLDNLPLLNKHSDYRNWLKLVKSLVPAEEDQEFMVKVLRDDDEVMQMLVWTKVNYPDEVHDDVKESFIILQGECECYISEDIYKLGPGGFLDIPMHLHHDVKVTKGPVMAIVQRLKVA